MTQLKVHNYFEKMNILKENEPKVPDNGLSFETWMPNRAWNEKRPKVKQVIYQQVPFKLIIVLTDFSNSMHGA